MNRYLGVHFIILSLVICWENIHNKNFFKKYLFFIARIMALISTSFSLTPFMLPVEETLAQEVKVTLLLSNSTCFPPTKLGHSLFFFKQSENNQRQGYLERARVQLKKVSLVDSKLLRLDSYKITPTLPD